MAQWRTNLKIIATGGAQLLMESVYRVERTKYARTVWARTVTKHVYWKALIRVGCVGVRHGWHILLIANASTTSKKRKKTKNFYFQEKWIKQSILFEQQDGSSV
jgi:hypothetical protein